MFIAEIGINHNGDIDLAKQLIDLAKQSDCDVVKFQKRNPDICVPESYKNRIKSTPWGDMSYLEYKHKIEFGKKEYDEIDRYCKSKPIDWTASVWDLDSLKFLVQYDIPFIKVPSAKITDINLLNNVRETGIPTVMSLGMSTFKEIDKAVNIFKYTDLILLWCNSSYPTKDNELDLNVIPKLKNLYSWARLGYSGHEEGISACIIARVLGAEVFEKHITLSRSMWGTDQAASLVYDQLWRLVRDLRKVDVWRGSGDIQVYGSEKLLMEKMREND
jgi:N-acetylneuraminate synthase|tara:strand:- start:1764 stop:2585 length:822 start_codon:yes stop_codon:yes gene_type:complete